MREQHFFFVPDAAAKTELPEDEAKHALRVLRVHAGDTLWLMDGNGTFYEAEATITNNKHCFFQTSSCAISCESASVRRALAV